MKTVITIAALLALSTSVAVAQQVPSLEDLEKQVAEQKAALEEAIANREATAAKAQEIQDMLNESEEKREVIEAELDALCKEQEELKAGTYDECLNSAEG